MATFANLTFANVRVSETQSSIGSVVGRWVRRGAFAAAIAFFSISVAHAAPWLAAWKADPTGSTGAIPPGTQTLREIITPRRSGEIVRLRLTNREGTLPVSFSEVWIGRQLADAQLVEGSNRQLTFNGESALTLQPGEDATSDPLSFPVRSFEKLAISMQAADLMGFLPLSSSHSVSRELNFFSLTPEALGGGAETPSGDGFQPFTFTGGVTFQASWHFINGLDVESIESNPRTVVAFGDSISDGLSVNPMADSTFVEDLSTLGFNERYTDFLQRRFDRLPGFEEFTVVDAGIAGNRLTEGPFAPFFGPRGLDRLETDVIAVPGVTDVIIQMGINDLAFDIPAQLAGSDQIVQTVISGLEEAVRRFQEENIRVILSTITPALGANGGFGAESGGAPILEAVGLLEITETIGPLHGTEDTDRRRNMVNDWVRGPGAEMADGVVDFDQCVRNPENPGLLRDEFNGGDNLHPNPAGYQAMADCFDIPAVFPRSAGALGPDGVGSSGGGSFGLSWLMVGLGLALRRRIATRRECR